jgi:hypothetical protein
VPALVSLSAAAGSGHAAQFHMNDRAFLDEISEFVGFTLQSGESIVVVATEETRAGIGERLKARGIDVSATGEFRHYAVMDAAECLGQFMF